MAVILVVDDASVFRETIAAALRCRGHTVRCAANGETALAILQSMQPDLVLLDLAMPRITGLDLLRMIRDDERLTSIPVILLTAMTDEHCFQEAMSLGVNGCLLKSQFSLQELATRIEEAIATAQSRGEERLIK